MFTGLLCFVTIFGLSQSSEVEPTQRFGTQNRYEHFLRSSPYTANLVFTPDDIIEAFLPNVTVVIIIHGHQGGNTPDINLDLKYEIFTHYDYNIVMVDWSAMANGPYEMASMAVPSIGQNVFTFIQNVIAAGFSPSDIRLIGFDLGAHVCGFAGRPLNGEISHITGLNPRGGDWTTGTRRPLGIGDAQVVEVIHTNNVYGIAEPIGDIDFFINGGLTQPGCSNHECHHLRAYDLMTATIDPSNIIQGHSCARFADVRANACRGRSVRVGSFVTKFGGGIYRANTASIYPF